MAMHATDSETKFAWETILSNMNYVYGHEYYSELPVVDTGDNDEDEEEEEEGVDQGPKLIILNEKQNARNTGFDAKFRSQARASWKQPTSTTRPESS